MIDSIAHRIGSWLAPLARALTAVLFFMAGT